jgi:hypothetical protein
MALSRSVKDDRLLLLLDIVPPSSSVPLIHLYTTSTSVITIHPATSNHQGVCLLSPIQIKSGFRVSLYWLVILQATRAATAAAQHTHAVQTLHQPYPAKAALLKLSVHKKAPQTRCSFCF